MRKTSIALGAILAAGLTTTREARAQYWLQDRALTEGRGIRAGSFEFHPSLGAEVGFDSNVRSSPPDVTPVQAIRLRITPSISISTLGAQRTATPGVAVTALPTANFRAQVGVVYHAFFGLNADVSTQNNLGAMAGFRLELFPQRTWQFNLADDFGRIVQGGPEGGLALALYARDVNRASAELVFAPNGGIIDARLGYANQITYFENPDPLIRRFSVMTNEISLRNRWRFLPKTALLWEALISPTTYLTGGGPTGLFNSTPVQTRFGLNGLFTERFGLLVMVGYGGTFFDRGDNASTVIAQAEARWITGPASSFRVGLQRDIQPAFLGNYYVRNRLYLNFSQNFGGRFLFNADASASINENGYVPTPAGGISTLAIGVDPMTGRFLMFRAQAALFGEYRMSDIFGINLTTQVTWNNTDAAFQIATATFQSLSWLKFEIYAGARVNW